MVNKVAFAGFIGAIASAVTPMDPPL